MISRFTLFVLTISLLSYTETNGQTKTDPLLKEILSGIQDSTTKSVLKNPDQFRVQIIYTQINRDKKGKPSFTNYQFNVDPDLYFNPASMVKMPLAFLSLEKLQEMNKPGVNKNTRMKYDSNYVRQVAMTNDSSAENSYPSIAHFIKRAFLISENDPYNRMYQFVGQQQTNKKLIEKGYTSTRITRQFMGYTEEENRHTNGIQFIDEMGNTIYSQVPQYNTDSFQFPSPIMIGNAHINREDQLVATPFDFTKHNNLSLEDMRKMIQSVVFPNSGEKKNHFNISEEDRLFLLQYMSQYPSETNYPKYDSEIFYDSYVKFFFSDSSHKIPDHIRIFNKVGWAYGFMTDVSYVLDTKNNIDYMLSATIYVNSDGVVNDSKYDEEAVGFPFFDKIGRAIYSYELSRSHQHKPALVNPVKVYEKRDPSDKRPAIKQADN
jgi:hypothetical protein